MRSKTILIIGTIIFSSCTSIPSREAPLPAQGSACIQQEALINSKKRKIKWCIESKVFEPRQYAVDVAGKPVFSGKDNDRVSFQAQTEWGRVVGECDEIVLLLDTEKNHAVLVEKIPKTTVDACGIKAYPDGRSQIFNKTAACDKYFYKDLAPLIGPVMPVEVMRKCYLSLEGQPIFNGTFHTERRF